MDVGYENKPLSQTFEGLEQKFLDDIMKLAKEQSDAEDAENARHKEVCMIMNVLLSLAISFISFVIPQRGISCRNTFDGLLLNILNQNFMKKILM